MTEVRGLISYVFCADAGAVADWCTTVLGWAERGRWSNDDGVVTNVELDPGGGGEVWLDGPVSDWDKRTGGLGSWVGMVVDDVDAVHARLLTTPRRSRRCRDRLERHRHRLVLIEAVPLPEPVEDARADVLTDCGPDDLVLRPGRAFCFSTDRI